MTNWQPIETVPKCTERVDFVADEFVVWLYDPDLERVSRVQPAFWNSNYNGWQILIDTNAAPRNPTHWMPYEPPAPPNS